jgi:hypothetical protein
MIFAFYYSKVYTEWGQCKGWVVRGRSHNTTLSGQGGDEGQFNVDIGPEWIGILVRACCSNPTKPFLFYSLSIYSPRLKIQKLHACFIQAKINHERDAFFVNCAFIL